MSNETQLPVFAIGTVISPVTEAMDNGWGDVIAAIELFPEFASGLQGLAEFSHVQVIFWMHLVEFSLDEDLVRHPRDNLELPRTGIFSQRARHRPNPIGITATKLMGVDQNRITVKGLDAVNGTPVLDIKPYVSSFDRIENPVEPLWLKQMLSNYFSS